MSSCPRIESLVSLSTFHHPFAIGSLHISSCREMVGRPILTTFRGMSLSYCIGGRPLNLVRLPPMRCFSFNPLLVLIVHSNLVYSSVLK